MSVAAPLALREGDRSRLEALARSTSIRAGLARRARIVLLAAAGLTNAEIARQTGSTKPTVLAWRNRYVAGGITALGDKPRSGRPTKVDEIEVVATTLADNGRPPEHLGASYWSSRLLARELGISYATVARIWRKWGIEPHRLEILKFPVAPELDATVGRYRNPLGHPTVRHRHRPVHSTLPPRRVDHAARRPDPWHSLVEASLGIITYQAIRRGTFASVHNLIDAIGALTDGWSDRQEPITAPSPSSTALARNRKATSNTPPGRRDSPPAEDDLKSDAVQRVPKPRERA